MFSLNNINTTRGNTMRSITSFEALTTDQLRIKVPSIFTQGGSDKTSDKYTHISTIEIVQGLMKEGFVPVRAMQTRARIVEKRPFTKHMLRFRHQDAVPAVGGLFPELVLINSHDGLSSYRLTAGLYRLLCSNGLVAGNNYEEVRVRHQGDILGNVIEGSYEVMNVAQRLLETAAEMSEIHLSHDEKLFFAEAAHSIKFEDEDAQKKAIVPQALLKARRYQEVDKHDLFTTFNVVQENIIKGGLRGWTRDANGRNRISTTREVKSIDQNTYLNRALWTLAEKMGSLKTNKAA